MSNTVAPPLSLLPMASRRWPRRMRREQGVPLGNNTTGCSLSLAGGTVGNFEKTKDPVDGAVGKHAKVRDIGVVGLPESVGIEVKAVVVGDALCELVVVDFLSASVAE
eukprot:3020632-Pleurochrysis_carterae.AAC.1